VGRAPWAWNCAQLVELLPPAVTPRESAVDKETRRWVRVDDRLGFDTDVCVVCGVGCLVGGVDGWVVVSMDGKPRHGKSEASQ